MPRLTLLGDVELCDDEGRALDVVTRQPRRLALLTYIALARPTGFHRRDELLALFWSERDDAHARDALSSALHFLRRQLGEGTIVQRGASDLRVDPSRLWCDVRAFEEALAAARPRDAIALYRGDLLPGFHIEGAHEFDAWLEERRNRLRERAKHAALGVARESRQVAAYAEAAEWSRVALRLDPYDERALRGLVVALAWTGDRAGALHEFARFERALREGIGATPMPATRALIERVRGGDGRGPLEDDDER